MKTIRESIRAAINKIGSEKVQTIIEEISSKEKQYMLSEFKKIFDLPFVSHLIESHDAEVFIVGGTVRDFFLGKTPKDVDFIVKNIPIDKLMLILKQWGKVDLVGESFGVIKFSYKGEVYDIALPRTDKKIDGGKGHKAIDAQADHTLPIEADLLRRDITINSIAIDSNLKLVDPFNGIQDITDKLVRATSPESFIDDPLRMMRAIGMATRFEFDIEENTFEMILLNNHLIKEISGERMFDEINKVVEKNADIRQYQYWLSATGLWQAYTGIDLERFFFGPYNYSISEVLFCFGQFSLSGDHFAKTLKVTNDIKNEINALFNYFKLDNMFDADVWTVFSTLKKTHIVLTSPLCWSSTSRKHFISGLFPKSTNELALSGEDFIALGIPEGKGIGDAQKKCLEAIFSHLVKNTKEELTNLIK